MTLPHPLSHLASPFLFWKIKHRLVTVSCGSPVVEVHDGLESVPSPCGDVSLEARKQRGDHIHAVLFTLPVSKTHIIKTENF